MSLLLLFKPPLAAGGDVSVNAELASGAGSALLLLAHVQPSAAISSGTGTAANASVKISASAAAATGTGAAGDVDELTTVTGTGAATGTGSALNVIPLVAPNAGLSSGTGSAHSPPVNIAPNAAIAAGSGQAYDATVSTAQVLRPISDLSGNWHGEDARTTTLYTSVDDSPFNDATYVESPDDPTSSDYAEFDLPSAGDPLSSSDHVVRYRYGGEGTATLVVELRQGATVIASWSHIDPTTPALAEQTLTSGEADAITDYTDLRIRVRAA